MKLKTLLFGTLGALLLTGALTACDNNNEPHSKVTLPEHRAFILYEGVWNSNNAGIAFYAPDKNANPNIIANLYQLQNNKGLGDVAQDIVASGNELFVTVSNSRRLVKLNKDGVELASLSFSQADGDPRYMTAKDGKLYVTLYSGQVARINAATMEIEAYVKVGDRPEHIAELNGKLYVSDTKDIYGTGTQVNVVDIASFTKEKDIDVIQNPHQLLPVAGDMYLISWGNWGVPTLGGDYTLQRIKADGTVENVALAKDMAYDNGIIYLDYVKEEWEHDPETNKSTLISRESFLATYNTKTHEFSDQSFVKDAPAELFSSFIYGINIDPANGDIYLTTTDYTTTGDVYRFKNDGTFIEKFDCGGINPNKIIFPE
ncbi:MAG: hypothetical protein LBM62_06155 [Mediterranea sp.]|jgi:hypothetical protein|nr:hypothetical protein [Mediterranea sp.]